MSEPSRHPGGMPIGGRFASTPKTVSGVALGDELADFSAEQIVEGTDWSVASEWTDGPVGHAYLLRHPGERLSLQVDRESGIVSLQDSADDADTDEPPFDERTIDPADSSELERAVHDMLSGLARAKPEAPPMLLEADGRVAMRIALKQIDKEKPAVAVITMRYSDRHSSDSMPDIRPPDGTILEIDTRSGMFHHKVIGGRVMFRANSSWGNSITVNGGDVHIVTDGMSRKVTVDIAPDDPADPPVVTVSREDAEDPRSRIRAYQPGAKVELAAREHGPDQFPEDWGS